MRQLRIFGGCDLINDLMSQKINVIVACKTPQWFFFFSMLFLVNKQINNDK